MVGTLFATASAAHVTLSSRVLLRGVDGGVAVLAIVGLALWVHANRVALADDDDADERVMIPWDFR